MDWLAECDLDISPLLTLHTGDCLQNTGYVIGMENQPVQYDGSNNSSNRKIKKGQGEFVGVFSENRLYIHITKSEIKTQFKKPVCTISPCKSRILLFI